MNIESLLETLRRLGFRGTFVYLPDSAAICLNYETSRAEKALDDAWERFKP
jgi:hypothetical protein